MTDAPTHISLNGLEKRFAGQEKPALASLTAEIYSGAVTGLVGPDGAGKTTLLRMLAGLLTPVTARYTSPTLIPSTRIVSSMPFWAICRKNSACMKI